MFLKFNLYGFIIGLAIVTSISLIDKFAKNDKLISTNLYKIFIFILFFGLIGARFWHVATDFYYYQQNPIEIFFVWNGGLSIIGAIVGGIVGLIASTIVLPSLRNQTWIFKKNLILKLLDVSIFGLPVGQMIGRVGNYVNQEIYGLPTNNFFKIYIDENHRLKGFEKYSYYHPLFLYEILAIGFFCFILYLIYLNKKILFKIINKHNRNIFLLNELDLLRAGSGNLFVLYIFYYSLVRFFLDSLRIDRGYLFLNFFGANQVFLLGVLLNIFLYFFVKVLRIIKIYVK